MSIPFDSHKYAKRLMEAGMSPALADIQAETTADLMNELHALNVKLDNFIIKSEANVETKIAEGKTEVIRWVVGVGAMQFSLVAAMLLKMAQ